MFKNSTKLDIFQIKNFLKIQPTLKASSEFEKKKRFLIIKHY